MTSPRFKERLSGLSTGSRRTPVPVLLGGLLAPVGLLLVFLGWLGASRTPLLQEQVPYLISGGLFGLALVVLGGFCYFAHWQTEVLREVRLQTAEVTAALRAGMAPVLSADSRLLATAAGTLAHRPGCSVLKGREDLHAAAVDAPLCAICEPVR